MSEILYWSATRLAREIRSKSLSSRQAVQACLDRMDAVNPAINAVVQRHDEDALVLASEYDQKLSRGEIIGPLHGVPVTLKDSIDTRGMISTGGTLGRRDYVPDSDATVAARLRAAGAIIMGKTNTPELTLSGETNNQIYGRTCNPFDPARSPGGSSGGSAAVIATGCAYLELGSDTGGSIREPAHLCGITGLKPTTGRVPLTGHIVPFTGGVMAPLTQIGPMARYVEDLETALSVICGPDGIDPYVYPVSLRDSAAVNLKRLRIAWYADNGLTSPHPDISRVVSEVAAGLSAEGFNLTEVCIPDMKKLVGLSTALREAANVGLITRLLERYGTTEPGPDLDGYFSEKGIAEMRCFDPELMEKIDIARSRALQFFQDYDAVLCPPSHAIARPHKSSHSDSFNDWSYMTIHNLLGWPGGSVRAGTSSENYLPVGVQVVAAPWREDRVIALLKEIESRFGGYSPPDI